MSTSASDFLHRPTAKRWGFYFVKAAIAVGFIYLCSKTIPTLPPFCVALLWAVLSAASATGLAYHAVIRKTHRQLILKEGGRLAKLNSGRILSLVVSFVLSAVFMAGLIIETPKWPLITWIIVGCVALAFPLLLLLTDKLLSREYEPPFSTSKAVLASSAIAGVALCALYAISLAVQPAATYASSTEAFLAAPKPFDGSPSALMGELGSMVALVDGIVAYGVSKAAEVSFGGYLAWQIALCGSAFFGIASLFGLCSLEWHELAKVFLPLEASKKADGPDGKSDTAIEPQAEPSSQATPSPRRGQPFVKRYAIAAAILPLCLVGAFLFAEHGAAQAAQTQEYTAAEAFIRDQVGIAAYMLDGTYYDQQAVQELVDETREKSEALFADAEKTLKPLINDYYDSCLQNVDGYLDWYYSLPADYERLVRTITGSVEDFVQDEFENHVKEGVDDSQLTSELESYVEQASALEADFEAALAQHEITGVPDWLVTTQKPLEDNLLAKPLEPTHKLLDGSARMGISAGGAIASGLIARQLTKKALTKPFFSKIVARITGALASRSAGAVVGGAAGSLAGPIGSAAGVVVGTAAGVGIDYSLLKIDEAQNRAGYKDEITQTIEEARADMLALINMT